MSVDLEFDYDTTTSTIIFNSESHIKDLQEWTQKLDKSKCVPKNLSNKQLVLFYSACNGDMDKIKTCIEKYYICRRNAPEFFNHRVLKMADLRLATEMHQLFILPGKSCDGYDVIYYRLFDTDYTKYDLESFCKLFFMTFDLCLFKRGPGSGFIVLFDMQGIQFGHLTKANPIALAKLFQYIQNAVPLRLQANHVINAEPLMDKIMAVIKPFLHTEFYNMVKLHNKGEDLEKLYEVIPKNNLPSDYGGDLPDTQTLHKQCMEQLMRLEPYFKAEEEQRFAAMPDNSGANTLEGTFKKLEID